jgi:arylsulfatase A-like enzyme
LHLLVALGATAFFAGAWANVTLLPGFTEPLSIVADLALLAATAFWFRRRYRDTALDGMRLGRWCVAGVAAAAVATAFATAGPERSDGPAPDAAAPAGAARPNVLLYLCDTLRADRLSCYGFEKPTSPEIDAFAQDATRFLDCRAVTSWTKPSVASMVTSLYPTMHGCVEQRQVLAPQAETLAEVFRAAGWRTAAFVDNPFISPEFGFGQGFDAYRYVRPSVPANGTLLGKALFMTRILSLVGRPFGVGEHVERGAPTLHREFLAETADARDRPWFAYVHAMEPHLPYEPARADAEAMGLPAGGVFRTPPDYNGILPFEEAPAPDAALLAALNAQYDGEVRGFSRHFGALIEALRARGDLERTIVVLVADHGEEFHEHRGWTHGHSLHREVTQVPLVVRLPASLGEAAATSRGRRVGGVATLLDVFPTLLDLCSIRHPHGESRRAGMSLAPLIRGKSGHAVVPERTLLGEVSVSPVGIRSIREGRWMLMVAHEPLREKVELYDDTDPHHARNQAEDQALVVASLTERLAEAFDVLSKAAYASADRDLDPETERQLRKIGYFGGK